ncbi:hypothetical protein PLEOSDRAFT_1093099 [Pleurotus ostreatus PC15]|uniref:Up-regulated during septation protein 1 domain-containing protein n=1 Tax=Pleurotus ostreatus (strain PC15) TaxID=1137138 RepID=A0A067NZW4_PLEO1|nr:hypothetical protein PLEOSDRAFT_1093099 [Pleurotus ostreatus PC15]
MNGVRRFLGGTAVQLPQQPPEQEVPTAPLIIPLKGPSWPPQAGPQSPPATSLSGSPKTSSAALFLRKERNRSQASIPSEDLPRTPPLAGSSIPTSSSPSRVPPQRRSTASEIKQSPPVLNTRDELLISLLASEAVVDSRGFNILGGEEVEELKKEHQVLSSRLVAIDKKLALETKMRDAAISLSKVNSTQKKTSKQTDDQLDAANTRLEAAQKEQRRISERANEIHKKLMEHRAAVLSLSIRNMEKKAAPQQFNGSSDSGYDTPAPMSPTTSSMTGVSSSSKSRGRFDGAHYFAGHADAVVPRRRLSLTTAASEISTLEDKLKAATASLNAASKKQAEMARDLSLLRLEKQEVEMNMGLELQGAEETIASLQQELPTREQQLKELLSEREAWVQERTTLQSNSKEVDVLRARLAELELRSGQANSSEAESREDSRRRLEEKEAEIQRLKAQWEEERAMWERDKAAMEDEKMEDLARLQDEMERMREEDRTSLQNANEELDAGHAAIRELMQKHGVVLYSRDSSILGLLHSVGVHLDGIQAKLEGHDTAKEEWEALRRKLEEDVRIGLDKRESLAREIEEARKEREEARKESRHLEAKLKDTPPSPQASRGIISPATSTSSLPDVQGEAARMLSILTPLWSILPSAEARAARFSNSRNFRTGSPTPGSPVGGTVASLSDLDVRSLKTLYDPNTANPNTSRSAFFPGGTSTFTIEAFAARVQSLVADDRALIERLLRFAQAHDLLKKNAERAQKLAQESNVALETYQKQVKMLEDRTILLSTQYAQMQEEAQKLQQAVERITAEKLDIETQAAEQAETCRQLTDANNTLSARALHLAEEAANAPEMVKRQLEAQLAECKATLKAAEEEIEAMRTSEQSQRIALMDELNSMQTENSNLRAQLRAVKK